MLLLGYINSSSYRYGEGGRDAEGGNTRKVFLIIADHSCIPTHNLSYLPYPDSAILNTFGLPKNARSQCHHKSQEKETEQLGISPFL